MIGIVSGWTIYAHFLLRMITKPTPEQMLKARVNEFTLAIKLLLDAKHTLPALVLMYTALDVFGSLLRPESEDDTKGDYFRKWVDDYMLSHCRVPYSAADLWGARCGLLHTHTAASRDSRHGKARQLHYYRANVPLPVATQQAMKAADDEDRLFVDVDGLHSAFVAASHRFLTAVEPDSELKKRVLHHSAKVFGRWTDGH